MCNFTRFHGFQREINGCEAGIGVDRLGLRRRITQSRPSATEGSDSRDGRCGGSFASARGEVKGGRGLNPAEGTWFTRMDWLTREGRAVYGVARAVGGSRERGKAGRGFSAERCVHRVRVGVLE
ncbi:hypothetical protein KFK09_007426 [Dendrobium nobile]|uniref:Uncharacterized protein n=1 Tax=Dendrobium nobile TaxID=94219 RepID=A0A8T3BWU4_DENNO|nr:hypothetical protein KFK09_007426 [Dendrobium nobile]